MWNIKFHPNDRYIIDISEFCLMSTCWGIHGFTAESNQVKSTSFFGSIYPACRRLCSGYCVPVTMCLLYTFCGLKSPLKSYDKEYTTLHTHTCRLSVCVCDSCCDRWQLIANRALAFQTSRDRWVFIYSSHPAETKPASRYQVTPGTVKDVATPTVWKEKSVSLPFIKPERPWHLEERH